MASRCVGCQNRDAAIADLTKEVDRLRKIHGEYDLEALLQTYILLHKDKVTAHWLWVAIERIGGGEVVAECLEDYGYVPLARAEAAERKLARLVEGLKSLPRFTFSLDEGGHMQMNIEQRGGWIEVSKMLTLINTATGEGK